MENENATILSGNKKVTRTFNIKQGTALKVDYETEKLSRIPVMLIDWSAEIPEHIRIEDESDVKVVMSVEDFIKYGEIISND